MVKSIRSFVGAKAFNESRSFYLELGFSEKIISPDMSFFFLQDFGFYLQDYYVLDWINNSMLFLEVTDLEEWWIRINSLNLMSKYKKVKLSGIKQNEWGQEFFLHDPAGVLWHIGTFN